MSTHDAPATDEDRLEEVRESLVERDTMITEVWRRVEEIAGDVDALASDQTAMSLIIEHLVEDIDEEESAAVEVALRPWTRMPRTRQDWLDLVAWVDEMSAAHSLAEMPVCWPAHEQLVLELDAARAAWNVAVARHQKTVSDAMWSWYSYVWTPLRARLAAWDRCRNGHIADPVGALTGMEFLPPIADALVSSTT